MNNTSQNQIYQMFLFVSGALFGGMLAFFCWGMLTPGDPSKTLLPDLVPHQDKVLHFIAFGMMAAPSAAAFPRSRIAFLVMSFVALAGGVEVAQAVGGSGRSGSWIDFACSAAGAILACIVVIWMKDKVTKKIGRNTHSSEIA